MPRKKLLKRVVSKVKLPAMKAPAEGSLPSAGGAALDALRGEILQLVAATNAESVQARAQVGKLLLAVKAELEHGEWLFWLNDHVPFTAATAKRAIQLWHLSQSDPAAFEALRPLGLTKAYKLMGMAPSERDAFLGKAHEVPGAGLKTPVQMTFEQMMAVLHPPEEETEVVITTKLVKAIRRQTLGLGRLLRQLWERVPAAGLKEAVAEALGALAHELEEVAEELEDKSLIEGNVPSFG